MIFVVSLLLVLTAFGASSVVTPCPGRESHQMIPIELEVSSPIQQGQNLTVHVRGEAQQEIEPLANVQVFYRSGAKSGLFITPCGICARRKSLIVLFKPSQTSR